MDTDLKSIGMQARKAMAELLQAAELTVGQIAVVGCSTSEVRGAKIGSAGSEEIAAVLLNGLREACADAQVFLAVQCCEHLNRALVVERQVMEQYRFEQVSVRPIPHAGGALAAQAMRDYSNAVVVETISAHAGLDIGSTLIGMHLKRVAVPVRLVNNQVGQALVTAARTRPKLIGGVRAVYE